MKLFIPRIPVQTTRSDLYRFVETAGKGRIPNLFSKKPEILSCEVVVIIEKNGLKERHGVVEMMPDKAAKAVVRRLHGKALNGKRVIVREYFERQMDKNTEIQDERRRSELKIGKQKTVQIEGLAYFSRSRRL